MNSLDSSQQAHFAALSGTCWQSVKWWLLLLAFLGLFVHGCTGEPEPKKPVTTLPMFTGPGAFVISRNDQSGLFGVIDLDTQKVYPKLGPASDDAVARYWDGYFFVINRFGHDNIQVMDAKSFALKKQYSVGPGSNPQDIAVVSEKKAYVSRLAKASLLMVDPLTGQKQGEIDLSHLAEPPYKSCTQSSDCRSKTCQNGKCKADGLPELSKMLLHDGKLFVLVQRLDRFQQFAPNTTGKIAVIDTESDKILKILDTKGMNPISMQLSADQKLLYVAQVGVWLKDQENMVLDGQIETFDVTTLKHKGTAITEQALGGNIGSFTIPSETVGYAIRTGKDWKTELVQFHPGTGKVLKTIATSPCIDKKACYTFTQIRHHKNDMLYLVDRNLQSPGIRIFDAKTGQEKTQKPIDMGLPPSSILFYTK